MPGTFLRARKPADVAKHGQPLYDVATFGPAPPGVIGGGRFNHAGAPMIYLATTAKTALLEIGTLDELFSIAELALHGENRVLDLVGLGDCSDVRIPILAMANSVLVAAPRIDRGWLRPEYLFSRFGADCAKSAGFDAVRYASTKLSDGENYVSLSSNSNLRSYLHPICVQKTGAAIAFSR